MSWSGEPRERRTQPARPGASGAGVYPPRPQGRAGESVGSRADAFGRTGGNGTGRRYSRQRERRRHDLAQVRPHAYGPRQRRSGAIGRARSATCRPGTTRPIGAADSSDRRRGSRGTKPQGRERSKHTAGPEEEQAARVARNGAGGTKRVRKPATRLGMDPPRKRRGKPRAGKWTPRAGNVGGVTNLRGGRLRPPGRASSQRPGAAARKAREVLEGERKAMSVVQPERKLTGGGSAEDARDQAARPKVGGGSAKPHEWIRRVVKR